MRTTQRRFARRYPAKATAVRQAFRELQAFSGRPTPEFLKPQKKIRHGQR